MIPQCDQCGYRLLVIFQSQTEMQEILKAAGWICALFNRKWRIVCPSCRKEITRESP